ncbi:hypothetical protein G6O67_002674 [Ophiocordyceps sinensis]|nr:hypothetical protein G6O67_002674 [Ophiocordyceps sinensis]
MFPPVPLSGRRRRGMLSSLTVAGTSEAGEGGGSSSPSPASRSPSIRSVTARRPGRQSIRRGAAQPSSRRRLVSVAATPPRMQLSHADIHRWQQETSHAGAAPGLSRLLLRPLPPKNASPTKSSLRSPLKPRTPGRVVDFTSSVLSPAEQARARHERRLSGASVASIASLARPGVAFAPPAVTTGDEGGGDVEDVSMLDAPEVDDEDRPVDDEDTSVDEDRPEVDEDRPEPLSRTVWTRRHWLFLDELLQLRRRAPFALCAAAANRYLGKTVKSQGEAMRLEHWHLQVVDAFVAAVGGWDEGVLAKRLFALMLGEERRRRGRGRSERPPPVMFH